jgi:NAD(P)-dependent dehydrogenase (short-subunit alcohol dehydrogenase family)
MFDLTGKRALVTGASGGIGGAIAAALQGAGRDGGLRHAHRAARRAGRRAGRGACMCCLQPVGDAEAVDALPKRAAEAMGGVDILVNNAGITRDNLFMRMSDEEWEQVLDVNLTAALRLCRGRAARHDEGALGPDRLHHLDRRRHRQSRAGQLRGLEGRADRHVEIAGATRSRAAA